MGPGTVNAVPHSHYPTADGKWVAIACTNDKIFQRLAELMGRPELGRRRLLGNDREARGGPAGSGRLRRRMDAAYKPPPICCDVAPKRQVPCGLLQCRSRTSSPTRSIAARENMMPPAG